jgi:hypothetical protein
MTLPAGVWTQLTNANASAIRVQNQSGITVELQATNGGTAPSDNRGSIGLEARETLAADLTLAQLWPGIVGANRIWAFAYTSVTVSVSHADA